MEKSVAILDADEKQCSRLCLQLNARQFLAAPIHSLYDLKKHLKSSTCSTVIIDIDTVRIDNYSFKNLTSENSAVYFFCMSKDHFHPELKDIIGSRIYACIRKQLDLGELFYWLDCVP